MNKEIIELNLFLPKVTDADDACTNYLLALLLPMASDPGSSFLKRMLVIYI